MMSCKTCKCSRLHGYQKPCKDCHDYSNWAEAKAVSFPRLNGLKPDLQSCTLKVLEEIGELMQLLGKGQGASGETTVERLNNQSEWVRRTVEEALDSAQSLVTLVNTLLDEPGDIEIAIERHNQKLKEKGYLV